MSALIILRLAELGIAKKNEKWLLENGAKEYGASHYPFIVMLHVLFIAALILEYYYRSTGVFHLGLLIFYIACIAIKAWVILSLGNYWNTKIFRIPGTQLVKKGLYKYLRHPNYLIVILEIAIIPLTFELYYTAVIFSILNGLMLAVRIRVENAVLTTDH